MSFRKIQVTNLSSDVTVFNDPLVVLNNNESGSNNNDIGFIFERGTDSNALIVWDESEDHFAVGFSSSTSGQVTLSSYSDIKANSFIGNVTGNITGNLTGNVTGTVSSLSNLSTSNLSEGTNLYYTDTRFDTRLATKDTDDLSEGSTNLYFTNARVQSVIDSNTAGFITDYTVTQSDVTTHEGALSITESQISDLSHYTDAQAISAVEGESTLNLSSTVTTITDTATGSSAGPIIELYRNNPTPGNANYLGQLKFQGENSAGGKKVFAKITGKISDYTSSSEDGTIEFAVLNNGSNDIVARINENGLYLNAGHTLKFEGTVSNTSETTLTVANPSADRTITLPDATGTVSLLESAQTFSGATTFSASGNSVIIDDTLRIAQTGSGLRMTNVGAFDNDGSDNFRVFATNDLVLKANGDTGGGLSIDATNNHVTIDNNLIVGAGKLSYGGTLITATATNINYLGGVTSNIQTQIDDKQDSLTHNENSSPYVVSSSDATSNTGSTLAITASSLGFNVSNAISYSIFLNRLRLRSSEVTVNTSNGTLTFAADTLEENDEIDAVWIT